MPRGLAHHFLAIALIATASSAATSFKHPGRTIDAASTQPLVGVVATAYGSNKQVSGSGCPKYDEYIDDDKSNSAGNFNLNIPTDIVSYFVTYCRPAYEALTPESNDNLADGASVTPEPIRLWPLGGTAKQMRAAIGYLRDDTRTAVLALRDENVSTFNIALHALPSAEQSLVQRWLPTDSGNVTPSLATSGMTTQLKRLTTSMRVTLTYFAEANPEHFSTEIERFEDIKAYAGQREIRGQPTQPSSGSLDEGCGDARNLRALVYMAYSCDLDCDKRGISHDSIDRPTLLHVLASPGTAHLFLPEWITFANLTDSSGPWRLQLHNLRSYARSRPHSLLFLIGSRTAQRRLYTILEYLVKDGVGRDRIIVAMFSGDNLQLSKDDAFRLSISSDDYTLFRGLDRETSILNEGVHVVFVPCNRERLFREYFFGIWQQYKGNLDTVGVVRAEEILRTMLSIRTINIQQSVLNDLSGFCSFGGRRPVGMPSDLTYDDACRLLDTLIAALRDKLLP